MSIINCRFRYHLKFITRSSVIIAIQETKLCKTNRKSKNMAASHQARDNTTTKRNTRVAH